MSAKDISDVVKNCAESEVLIAAGLYFIVKTLQGFEAVDASITASAERSPTSERGADYLAVTIALKRGTKGSLRLHDVDIVVTQGATTQN